ncbi:MAG: class I SAM-dependent methyltransferase [Alphaproteobacteria bacterium]|nr:class I SAM-dependent methyltransferase [Alphaproteobacteria bacterium]
MLTEANADFSIFVFEQIHKLLGVNKGIKLLALGYTDILLSERVLMTLSSRMTDKSPIGAEIAEENEKGEGRRLRLNPTAFYRLFGFETTFIDLYDPSPDALKIDLNEPIPQDFHQKFDAVIDGGTIEHCFNVAQAIANMALATRVGGVATNGNPLFALNHGFYNMNPIFYEKFYEANGFEMCSSFVCQHNSSGLQIWNGFPPDSRTLLMCGERGCEYMVNVFAKKIRHCAKVTWPSQ